MEARGRKVGGHNRIFESRGPFLTRCLINNFLFFDSRICIYFVLIHIQTLTHAAESQRLSVVITGHMRLPFVDLTFCLPRKIRSPCFPTQSEKPRRRAKPTGTRGPGGPGTGGHYCRSDSGLSGKAFSSHAQPAGRPSPRGT